MTVFEILRAGIEQLYMKCAEAEVMFRGRPDVSSIIAEVKQTRDQIVQHARGLQANLARLQTESQKLQGMLVDQERKVGAIVASIQAPLDALLQEAAEADAQWQRRESQPRSLRSV